jgi:bacteriocin-like protein
VTKIIPATIDRTEAKPNNKLPAAERREPTHELSEDELNAVAGGFPTGSVSSTSSGNAVNNPVKMFQQALSGG